MADEFQWVHDWGRQLDVKPRIRGMSFGDGYAQGVEDGINAVTASWSLVFQGREPMEVARIEAFLRRHAGVRWFWWRDPEEQDLPTLALDFRAGEYLRRDARVRVKCESWTVSSPSGLKTITCRFDQVFAMGV